jgi:hypothetical protein
MIPAVLPDAVRAKLSELQLVRMAAEDAAAEEPWRRA